jgi:type IV fimbrial biogenesis protein FimT
MEMNGPNGGFTLVELLTVITIIGVLAAIVMPSMASLIANQRAGGAATDILFALATARSEATKRGVNVTLAQKTGGWKNGWEVYLTSDSSQKFLDHGALSGATTSSTADVVYMSSGRVQGTTKPSFTITMTSGNASVSKYVCVDLSGRPAASDSTCP